MDIDADAPDTVHPLRRYLVKNFDCFLHARYILMVFSEVMELPALCHRKGNDCLLFFLYLFCIPLLQGSTFFLKVRFHSRKILPKRPGFSFCDRVDVNFHSADAETVLIKGVEQGIFPFPAPVFHDHIKVRIFLLQTSASAPGHRHIHKLYVHVILVYFGLQIGVYGKFYIFLCLPIDAIP